MTLADKLFGPSSFDSWMHGGRPSVPVPLPPGVPPPSLAKEGK